MSQSINRVTLLGTVGRDAELKFIGNGSALATFSVATEKSWKDKSTDQWQKKTEWHNVTAWRKLAEDCGEIVKKGARVFVEGSLETQSWDNKDGVRQYKTVIAAEDVRVLASHQGRSEPATASHEAPRDRPQQQPNAGSLNDDLPF